MMIAMVDAETHIPLAGFPASADPEIEEMLKAGVHLGHAKSKNHPTMRSYIFGVRNTISILDLAKTKEMLASARAFLKKVVSDGGTVLLVGTRPAARSALREIGGKTHMPYCVDRWIGGTLTNFKIISKRVEYMERLERERASGEFEKYTKKERLMKGRDIERLRKMFDGIRTLTKLPQAVFIVDTTEDTTAVREARRMNIPVVALVDTNSDASLIDYPIPSNDDALPAVRYMVGQIGESIAEGQKNSTAVEAKE